VRGRLTFEHANELQKFARACRLAQRIKVRSDIVRITVWQLHVRHHRVGMYVVGPLDPVHQVYRSVRQLAREVYAVGEMIEWRTHQSARTLDAWDAMAATATIGANGNRTSGYVAVRRIVSICGLGDKVTVAAAPCSDKSNCGECQE
jgi:hypothetical protein